MDVTGCPHRYASGDPICIDCGRVERAKVATYNGVCGVAGCRIIRGTTRVIGDVCADCAAKLAGPA